MTAFILVAGAHTGGWIWREVAARLREAGDRVHPVTLTGMGGRSAAAGPGTDLEAHIGELLELIDRTDAAEVVLVGHCYGVYPVLGAADRRPGRIARIVLLDTGMPQHGDRALALVPDPTLRDRLAQRAEADEDGWRVPPPSREEWRRWGSTDGLPPAALDRLAANAVPQPAGTLTQPLRLTGAVTRLPVTGVLCTANGSSLAMVEALLRMGDPRFQALADPRVGFLELGAGHWPMLSCPDELADVLLRAAAGEGHRVAARTDEPPAHLRPFLLDVPERPRERVGRVDLYFPDAPDGLGDLDAPVRGDLCGVGRPWPAVVLVHGGPVHPDVRPTPRDWPGFVGYGRYVAARGAVAAVLDHRLHGLGDFARAAEDVAEAVALVRADPCVDADRVAVWCFSGGGLLSADWLAAPPPWLRCVAASYPILAPLPNWALVEPRFRPAVAVRTAGRLPIVLTRVGLETAEIAATVEEFLTAARRCGAAVEVVDVPLGHHGFETADHTDEAREALDRAVRSVLRHLRS